MYRMHTDEHLHGHNPLHPKFQSLLYQFCSSINGKGKLADISCLKRRLYLDQLSIFPVRLSVVDISKHVKNSIRACMIFIELHNMSSHFHIFLENPYMNCIMMKYFKSELTLSLMTINTLFCKYLHVCLLFFLIVLVRYGILS